jgi:peptidoglycan/LPS O-acetylase OafA/YrhL
MSDLSVAVQPKPGGTAWPLYWYAAAVCVFVGPKLFGFYRAIDIHRPITLWLFIILTDVLPFALIATWACRNIGQVQTHTRPGAHKHDPLLTVRFAACLMVVFGHYFGVVFPAQTPRAEHFHPVLRLLMTSPWAGVWLFFALSGYLMGKAFFRERYTLDSEGIARFICNRGVRILPVYVFAVLLVAVLTVPEIFEPKNWWILVQTLTLSYDGRQPINVIGALWSVSTEFQFYLLAPFLAILINAAGARFRLDYRSIIVVIFAGQIIDLLVAYKMHFSVLGVLRSIYGPVGSNLYLFASGMMLAKILTIRKPAPRARNLPLGMALLAGMILVLSLSASLTFYAGHHIVAYLMIGPVFALCGTLAVIWLFEISTITGPAALIVEWTQTGGILTYCLYVFHSPIMLYLRTFGPSVMSFRDQMMAFPFVAALIAVASYASYRAIEKPASALKI